MDTDQATFVLAGLFALRFAMPLAVTVAFGYAMNYLLERWQHEGSP